MWIKFVAYYRLGLANLARVLFYRLKLKFGYLRKLTSISSPIEGPFFEIHHSIQPVKELRIHQSSPLFGWHQVKLDHIPNWHQSVLSQQTLSDNNKHWSLISDFDSGIGDIKGIWELSRFSWAITFASNYLQSGDQKYLTRLNEWIGDWSLNNPANQGVNWKCAQEASLRVLHLASAAKILGAIETTGNTCTFVEQHLKRILPTTGYAIGQDNNHGTSEAAALYVGGSWLKHNGHQPDFATHCTKVGLSLLANRAKRLIMDDGSFSQYSVTYHRLMLDTYSFVEVWRKTLKLESLPAPIYQKLKAATLWLSSMTDFKCGDAPNLGTNDGAHILNFSHAEYRDFKPSVELAAQLFLNKTCFDSDECSQVRKLFDLTSISPMKTSKNQTFKNGGFSLLGDDNAWCVLRVPRFKFRPSQADILHLDLWVDGLNILRDGGSFSYNTEAKWLDYFSGCQSHNCIEFDGRPQMPKVSRFLFGQWPQYSRFVQNDNTTNLEYTDWQGVRHNREISLNANQLTVKDQFSGVKESALMRWRLCPNSAWELSGSKLHSDKVNIDVNCDKPLQSMGIAQGAESRYYGKKSPLPVLEVGVASDATIITIISW